MVQAERFVMHELYKLEKTALDGYATYNFAKGAYCCTYLILDALHN